MRAANIRWSWDHKRIDPSVLKFMGETIGRDHAGFAGAGGTTGLFGPGIFGVFAFSGDELAGMARVFSDDVTTTWLADLRVHPQWRGQGIGRSLLDRVNDRFPRTALYCDAPIGIVEFFKAAGIRPKIKLNACHRPPGEYGKKSHDCRGIAVHNDPWRCRAADFDHVSDSVGFGTSDKGMSPDVVYRRLFGGGVFGFFAEDEKKRLVGFARIFSDDRTKSYVAEICVHPGWQRRGVGRTLLGRTVSRFSHTAIYTEAFPEAVRLCESCGIISDPTLIGCSRAPLAG